MKTQIPIQNSSHIRVHINSFWIFLLLVFPAITSVRSQSINFCGVFPPHQANSSNPDSILYDRFGNSYDYDYFQVSEGPARITSTCGYFELDFKGIADSLRNTICEVFEDLSDLIELRVNEAPCDETVTAEKIVIYIAYDTTFKYPVLAAGSPQYSLEGTYACDETQLNKAYSKINGGKSFSTVYDGALFINPHDTFKNHLDTLIWHTDTGTNPGIKTFDLYSVILHEALHILGFASRIRSDDEGLMGYYSLWDNFIYTTSKFDSNDPIDDFKRILKSNCAENCWSLNDTVFNDINEFVSAALAHCTEESTLDFVFGHGIAPLAGGDTSLQAFSHLADSCHGEYVNYVMQPGIKRGIESRRRNITAPEREILCQLGYKMADCDECFVSASKEDPFEWIDYHNTCCYPIFNGCVGDTLEINFA